MPEITIDRQFLTKTLKNLVQINSVNPSLVPGAPGEEEIAEYVARLLQDIPLDVTIQEIAPGRFNVVGKLAGSGGGHSLMLNAHMDTVGVYDMNEPFSPSIHDGRLIGRGAFDMKGSLAACITAAKALVESGTPLMGNLLITAVADEEYISIGTEEIIKQYTADGAIVTEPTNMGTCIAHKGYSWFEIETIGRSAHGSRYKVGIDANLMMGQILTKLDTLSQELISRTGHPLVGPSSLHTATIRGGKEWSIYPDRCKLQIERRTIPGENPDEVAHEIQSILDDLANQDPSFNASMRTFFSRDSFEISADARIVRTLQQSAAKYLGKLPPLIGESFWMDSSLLSKAGIETVIFGPSGGGAHAQEEWVDLDSVYETANILAHTAETYCNISK